MATFKNETVQLVYIIYVNRKCTLVSIKYTCNKLIIPNQKLANS